MFKQDHNIEIILQEFIKNVTKRLLSEESKEDEQERLDRERLRQYNNPKVMASRARKDRQTPEWQRPLDTRTIRGLPSRLELNKKYLDNQKEILTDTVRDLKSLLLSAAKSINTNLVEIVFQDLTPEALSRLDIQTVEVKFFSKTLQETYQDFIRYLTNLIYNLQLVENEDFVSDVIQSKAHLRKGRDRLSMFVGYLNSVSQDLQLLHAQMSETSKNINDLQREIDRLLAKR